MLPVAQALQAGGIHAIEITMIVPGALGAIQRLARESGGDVLVGVGSVLDEDTARRAVEAGARFVVSPVFKPRVLEETHRQGAAALPGAFTPTGDPARPRGRRCAPSSAAARPTWPRRSR